MKVFESIKRNAINVPGWKTNRKIVVFESDDWGAIRMPSKEVYSELLKNGIRVDNDPYCKYDNLANSDDLTQLFDVLNSVRDINGNPANFTVNTIMTNPDFVKIKESNFKQYFFEPFTKTLQYYPNHENVFELWKQGISANVFKPQFHGREHLNMSKWLQALQQNEYATQLGFEHKTYGLTAETFAGINRNYMGAFDSAFESDLEEYKHSIREGLKMFESVFGYKSKSFIATTYTWSEELEFTLQSEGVKFLQGLINQKIPVDGGDHFKYKKWNYQGRSNRYGQLYLMRNCFFEPTLQNYNENVVHDCLKRIKYAFRWGKAAIICTHRLNYIGSIDEKNRINNIKSLQVLLHEIKKKWPDVEFMSSDELGEEILSSKYN